MTRVVPSLLKQLAPGRARVLGALLALGLACAAASAVCDFANVRGVGRDSLYAASFFCFGGVCLGRARWMPAERRAWALFGTGTLVWGLGWIAFFVIDRGVYGVTSIADGFWLAAYPAWYGGIALVSRSRAATSRSGAWLDGLIGAGAGAALLVALTRAVDLGSLGSDPATVAMGLAYPFADLVLLLFTATSFARSGGTLSMSGRLIGAALLAQVLVDSLFAMQVSSGAYTAGAVYDLGWPLAMGLLALSAVSASPREQSVARTRVVVPTAFGAVALGVLVYAALRPANPVAVALAAAALALALLRMLFTLRETIALADSRRLSLTDDLTGLPNRRRFLSEARDALATAQARVALLVIDLDGFKELNDTLGHFAGDELLRSVGRRLMSQVRGRDVVARLGGDEFGVLLYDASVGDAEAAAARIRASLAEPFPFDGIALRVTASIGIASAPDHAADVDALLRRADVAMYEAKRGRLGHAVYAATIDTHSRDRLSLLGELADGIHSGQLALRYQPMVCMRTGEITGAEALVRWNHPTRGELPPAAFLPWIEQTDLMRELSRFVLQAAVEQAADWRDAQRDWHIAVNVSPGDLLDLNFPNELTVLLAKHRLDPERLTIEVTESALLTDPRRVREVLTRLRARGIAIALDDFGTGYSSLTHLQELPADIVKIDRTFVARMGEHGSSAAIVRSVVQLAQALDMRVTAEGIEDAHRWRALGATGCDTAQGYFLARPLLAAELEAEAPAIAARARAAQAPPAQRPSVGSVVMTRATTASEALARRT